LRTNHIHFAISNMVKGLTEHGY